MKRFLFAVLMVFVSLPARADVDIKEFKSPGGINVWLLEEPSIPMVALELRFQGGASLDAEGKRGATNLMVGLLEEGAGDLDSQGFAKASESLAARYGYDVSDDTVAISSVFLSENRDEAMELLRLSIIEPRFDEASLERVRGQVLSVVRSEETDPNKIAGKTFKAIAFGDHPYGSGLNGTLESVSSLTRDDIVAAHQAALAKDRMVVSVVGDVTAEELGPMLDNLLGALPEKGAPLPPKTTPNLTGAVEVVEFDTPQSVAVFGQLGIERDDDDFFAAYLLNTILGGGGFESRLMEEVREKRGLTYGVYSYLVPKDLAALYMGSVASANDRIGEAVQVIQDEWARMANDGVTLDELNKAKALLTGAYPLRFDGNGAIAEIMVGMQVQGLPIDYIKTRNDKVNAVTLDEINRVASELLKPDALQFVIVGKPEGV
ncbi:Peptidase M16 inactive domain protein [Shimia thalassica]|uniref:Peptidase M16 inactive domain protein n=1 Tax=Shimia thalassica TaxID=1715693 RepID=A0A0P1IIA2_9RHOB|nr:pitrilysin family protein [Shimia thalassica]CUK14314.1 Peptidase M16 inactive domain protein [Shimia thalassica]